MNDNEQELDEECGSSTWFSPIRVNYDELIAIEILSDGMLSSYHGQSV